MITNIATSAGQLNTGALSTNISSSQLVRTSTGILYSVLVAIGNKGSTQIQVFKSINNGISWSKQDYIHSPLTTTTLASVAIDSSDLLHILYVAGSTETQIVHGVYSSATDTFGIQENAFSLINPLNGSSGSLAIAIDQNNIPHAIAATGSAGGGDTEYANRIKGFWTKVQLNTTRSSQVDIIIDNNNIPQIAINSSFGGGLLLALGNKNNATTFTTTIPTTVIVPMSIAVDIFNNTWLTFANSNGRITLLKHNSTDPWATWQIEIDDSNSGLTPSIFIDNTDIYIIYERTFGGLAYDKYDSIKNLWLGEQVLQPNTSPLTTNQSYHRPLIKWSTYFDNGASGANNTNSNKIEYIFDNGSTVFYSYLNTGQISTGLAQISFSVSQGVFTTSTSSTSSSTSTSTSTSLSSTSTSISQSTSLSSTSVSISISTSSTSSSTSQSTSTSVSSTSSSVSTTISFTTSTSSTSSSISTTQSTSTSISSTSSSTSTSLSSTSSSTSLSISTSISSTSSSMSTSISTSTSVSSTSSSTSISMSTSTSHSSTSSSTSISVSTSTSISSTSSSMSTSQSASTSQSSTSSSISTTQSFTTSISSTSSSISTSTSQSSTSSSTSTSHSSTSSSISSSTSLSSTSSSTSLSVSTTQSSTSSSISTSTSFSTTSQSTSTSFSTSSISSSTSFSNSTSSTSLSTSTTVSFTTSTSSTSMSSTSSSMSTTTILIDLGFRPRGTIYPVYRHTDIDNRRPIIGGIKRRFF